MVELDSDRKLLAANGRTAQRDIVQFVAFNNYTNYSSSQKAGEALAKALLAEIPSQLVSYMNSKGIAPGSRVVQ
jgi:copine 5/8/9